MNDWFVGYYGRLMSTARNDDTWVEYFLMWIKTHQRSRKMIRQNAGQE